MKKKVFGFPKKNPVFPKFWKICRKIDLFRFFSKSAPTIFLAFWIQLEGNIGLVLPKTACPAKVRFPIYGPEKTKKWVFSLAYISGTKRAIENLCRFSESSGLSLRKMLSADFRISTPSPRKLGPKIGTEKSPKTDFSIFLEIGSNDFLGILDIVRG